MDFLTGLSTKAAHLLRGASAEERAHRFLLDQGLKPVCRNFRCKYGELDLVMTDGPALVVVEVRFRKSDQYGSAAESITKSKQSRIIAATQVFLATQTKQRIDSPIRFDVVALSGNGGIDWIRNAF